MSERLTARLVYASDAKKVYVVDSAPPVSVRFSETYGVWCCLTCLNGCSEAARACAHVAAAQAADRERREVAA